MLPGKVIGRISSEPCVFFNLLPPEEKYFTMSLLKSKSSLILNLRTFNLYVPALRALVFLGIVILASISRVAFVDASVQWVDRVAAVVNDDAVMQSELNRRVSVIVSRLNAQNTPLPPMEIIKKRVLDQLIVESIELQLASRLGIRVDDSQLNESLRRIAAQNHYTLAQFRTALESEGTSFQEAREQIRHQMIIGRLQQSQVGRKIRITKKEIQAYLASAEGRKKTATEYYLGHIMIAVPDNATPKQEAEAKAKAEAVLQDLKRGVDFKQEAVAKSDGRNALQGGVLGWRRQSELPSIAADLIPDMKQGGFTGLLKTASGYHIIAVLNKRGGKKKIVIQTKVRSILIKPNAIRTNSEAKKLAYSLYNRLMHGDKFSTLAKAHSDDPVSAIDGGELGWISPGEMPPAFETAMNHTSKGKYSKPFQSRYGWYILEVEGHRQQDVGKKLLDSQARQAIYKRKFNEELGDWLRKIREDAYVDIKSGNWKASSSHKDKSKDGVVSR